MSSKRTIRFRAWTGARMMTPEECFHISSDDGTPYECSNGSYGGGHWDLPGSSEEVEKTVVMQFTGLLDMKGKEIYEGDILRVPPESQWDETNYVAYEVFYHDNDSADHHVGFQMNRYHFIGNICGTVNNMNTMLPKFTKRMVIIGNIHEHPELLTP